MSDLAEKFFSARRTAGRLEDDLVDEIRRILGIPIDEPDEWPFDDYILDDYDSSFEFRGCKEPEKLAEIVRQHRDELAALGFWQCWICEKPSGEYDSGIHIGFRKKEAP